MAPESFNMGIANARTDVYSLGVTVYELFSGGILPFQGNSPQCKGSTTRERIGWEHQHLPAPPISQFNKQVPPDIEAVVFKAISKNPRDRFDGPLSFYDAYEHARIAPKPSLLQTLPPTPIFPDPAIVKQPLPEPRGQTSMVPNPPPVRTIPGGGEKTILRPNTPAPFEAKKPHSEPALRVKGPYLVCVSGELMGQVIPIPKGGLTIGRDNRASLHLFEPSVSRSHALIHRSWVGVTIEDTGSRLGTFLNKKQMAVNTKIPLQNGDIIQFGYQQVFEFKEGN
jgi:serine/threonine protein kinase